MADVDRNVSLNKLRGMMTRFANELGTDDAYGKNKQKLIEITFNTLRLMAHRDILINGIIKKRCDQLKPFMREAIDTTHKDTRGFRIIHRDEKVVDKKALKYMQFFMDTGFGYDEDREDDLLDATDLIIRDTLVIDQIAIELRRTKAGEIYDFWVLDGATIRRNWEKNSKYKYVQVIEDSMFNIRTGSDLGGEKVVAKYTDDDIIFDYMNKRTDLRYRGWGYSPLEQAIDTITMFLFGINYNRDQFIKDRIPRGFIKIMGDVNQETIQTIQQYWYQQMSGYGAKWKIPIIPSGKEGVGMDFQKIGDSNRDMEYHKLMHLVMALKATVFGIDLEELGIKVDDAKTMIGDSGEYRLQHSKDSGLSSLLIFLENIYNKILKKIDDAYVFEFIGIKDDDREKAIRVRKEEVESFKTINEVRQEEGLEPLKDDYANVVLNAQAVSIYNQSKQAEMGGGGAGEEEPYDMGEGGEGGESPEEGAPEEKGYGAGEVEGGEAEEETQKSRRLIVI